MPTPLLPDFRGDPRIYYKNTYNINLFDYNIRRRYDVSSIPQYNYGYGCVLELKNHPKTILVQDIIANSKQQAIPASSF
jgi:hypothetical protein